MSIARLGGIDPDTVNERFVQSDAGSDTVALDFTTGPGIVSRAAAGTVTKCHYMAVAYNGATAPLPS